jgi:hypothetical protein
LTEQIGAPNGGSVGAWFFPDAVLASASGAWNDQTGVVASKYDAYWTARLDEITAAIGVAVRGSAAIVDVKGMRRLGDRQSWYGIAEVCGRQMLDGARDIAGKDRSGQRHMRVLARAHVPVHYRRQRKLAVTQIALICTTTAITRSQRMGAYNEPSVHQVDYGQ